MNIFKCFKKNSTEYCLKVMVILKNENSVIYFINHMTKYVIFKEYFNHFVHKMRIICMDKTVSIA